MTRGWTTLAALAVWIAGCTGDSPGSDIPPPDPDLVSVFFPIEGTIYGRGLPGAFPNGVEHVSVRAHPAGTKTVQPVQDDGSFTFNIIGISGDLLELSGAKDALGTEVGPPVYLRVPPTPKPQLDYVCCQERGTCQLATEVAREDNVCPDPALGVATRCMVDDDCNIDENEWLTINTDRIQVSAPNERGNITVTGVVEPNALIVVENRALNGVGIPSLQFSKAQVTDDIGGFLVEGLRARGDDEIVIQVRDLRDFRSPAVSIPVPDAELQGLDVVGVFAWEPLTNGARGPIAVHLAPWGIDGKGICPDSTQNPELCVSGGLDYTMVNFGRAEIAVGADFVALNPSPTATTAQRLHSRGREGDVRSGPQDIVVVLDLSAVSADKDPSGLRFDAVAEFISGLRARDRVALVGYSDTATRYLVNSPNRDSGLRDAADRQEIVDIVRSLGSMPAGNGSDVFAGIRAAASNLRNASSTNGRIVVIAGDAPPGTPEEALIDYDLAYEAVDANITRGEPEIVVDVIGMAIDPNSPNLKEIDNLTTFTSGTYYPSSAFGIEQTLTTVRSFLAGSFILLYDVDIPDAIGKSGRVSFDFEVLIGAKRATATYSGPLRILNSSNN